MMYEQLHRTVELVWVNALKYIAIGDVRYQIEKNNQKLNVCCYATERF